MYFTPLIGLSLSRCVADICSGKVDINQVAAIVAATRATDIMDLIPLYRACGAPWSKFSVEQIEMVLTTLKGRIVQPRLDVHYPPCQAFGWWVDTTSGTFFR